MSEQGLTARLVAIRERLAAITSNRSKTAGWVALRNKQDTWDLSADFGPPEGRPYLALGVIDEEDDANFIVHAPADVAWMLGVVEAASKLNWLKVSADDYLERLGKIGGLATKALTTDGAHHKQYFLEEILKVVTNNPHIESGGRGRWTPGVAP